VRTAPESGSIRRPALMTVTWPKATGEHIATLNSTAAVRFTLRPQERFGYGGDCTRVRMCQFCGREKFLNTEGAEEHRDCRCRSIGGGGGLSQAILQVCREQ